jgi:hypothetical protein
MKKDQLEKTLVEFGNYLLSEERVKNYIDNPNFPNKYMLAERLKKVNDADIQNFLQWLPIAEKLKITSEDSPFMYDSIIRLFKEYSDLVSVVNSKNATIRFQKRTSEWKFVFGYKKSVKDKNLIVCFEKAIEFLKSNKILTNQPN